MAGVGQLNRRCTNQEVGTSEIFCGWRTELPSCYTNQTVEGVWQCTVCQGADCQLGEARNEEAAHIVDHFATAVTTCQRWCSNVSNGESMETICSSSGGKAHFVTTGILWGVSKMAAGGWGGWFEGTHVKRFLQLNAGIW